MSLTADKRARLAELRREIDEILDPTKVEAAKRRKEHRAAMVKRVGKREKGQRQPRERDNAYLAYLRRQPCRVGLIRPGTCEGPIQACHVRYSDFRRGKANPGKQAKPSDKWAVSCCATHHAEQHARGDERAWWASYGLDGLDEAERQFAAFQGASNG